MIKENGGPAFAVAELANITWEGMTLRDYFAAKAMQGYCSDPEWRLDMDFSDTADASYSVADAMLKARKE
jgi:hypothetical protein